MQYIREVRGSEEGGEIRPGVVGVVLGADRDAGGGGSGRCGTSLSGA
jgi:hypothetical protein